MAAIYDYKNGHPITQGLQGCKVCDEAIQAAHWLAEHRNEPVHLEDDDGNWIVYPDGSVEQIEVKRSEGLDKLSLHEQQLQYWDDINTNNYY